MNPILFKEKSEIDVKDMQEHEYESIRRRRGVFFLDEGDPRKDAVGLALSGGGVRSATFNLGLLQALDESGFLRWVDYLSTVSGGGYIGSSLSWFMAKNNGNFPFGKNCPQDSQNHPLAWIRRHSSYLTPGGGVDFWALTAAILRGIIINLLVIIPIFFGVIFFLSWDKFGKVTDVIQKIVHINLPCWPYEDGFQWIFFSGSIILILLLVFFVMYAVSSKVKPVSFWKNRLFSVSHGRILKFGISCILIGILPLTHKVLTPDLLGEWQATLMSSISVTGLISLLSGWVGMKGKDETKGLRAFLIRLGLTLLIFVVALGLYRAALCLHLSPINNVVWIGFSLPPYMIVLLGVFLSLLIGLFSDINRVSMHRYYRDRLLEAYMPELEKKEPNFNEADSFFLKNMDIGSTGAPYHIVNATITTTGSKVPKYRSRGGASFVFSPLYIGSDATGYRDTKEYIGGEMSLATALSISGAAVDPNTGVTRSRPLSFIMTLLNIRLGYWLINPIRSVPRLLKGFSSDAMVAPFFWHSYAFREMLGFGLHENNLFVHLSDGGHFENLGLYELVRRRCPFIIVSDASADPDWTFKDLARACELVRADFNAEITIDTRPMHPKKKTGYSENPYIRGIIEYPDGPPSRVIYVKTALTREGLPEDIHGYKRVNDKFPDESTANQFFDETQFEAYRELGYRLGQNLMEGWEGKPKDLFIH